MTTGHALSWNELERAFDSRAHLELEEPLDGRGRWLEQRVSRMATHPNPLPWMMPLLPPQFQCSLSLSALHDCTVHSRWEREKEVRSSM